MSLEGNDGCGICSLFLALDSKFSQADVFVHKGIGLLVTKTSHRRMQAKRAALALALLKYRSTSSFRIYRVQTFDSCCEAWVRTDSRFTSAGSADPSESLNIHHRSRRDLLPSALGLQHERAVIGDALAAAGEDAGAGGDLERAAVEDAAAAKVGGLGEEAGTAKLLPAAAKGGEEAREDGGHVERPLQ